MYKVFVGNIPYNSNLSEFKEVFKDFEGIINYELIQNFNFTKNFGVLTLNSQEKENEIIGTKFDFKGRQLRITQYKIENNFKIMNKIIYVKNIPLTKNREWLKKAFGSYNLSKYFIVTNFFTGEQTEYGILFMSNYDDYNKLLKEKQHIFENITLYLSESNPHIEKYNI